MSENDIFNINPIVSTTICSIIGISLIGNLSAQEQSALGNWLMLIAQELITNATSQNLIQTRISSNNININSCKTKSIYNPIFYDINSLKKILNVMDENEYKNIINLLKKSINTINKEIDDLKN